MHQMNNLRLSTCSQESQIWQWWHWVFRSWAKCSNCTTPPSWFCSLSRQPSSTAPSLMQPTLRRLLSFLHQPKSDFYAFVLEGKASCLRCISLGIWGHSCTRSLLTNLVEPHEVAKMYAFLNLLTQFSSLIAIPTYREGIIWYIFIWQSSFNFDIFSMIF